MRTTAITTDLVTPLGAYLALRNGEPAFLLESVERGRLGRYSFVGAGARLVPFEDAEREVAAGAVTVGYLGYDHAARLEPVPLPEDRTGLPESRFVLADRVVRFDHAAGVADVIAGDGDELEKMLRDVPPMPVPEKRTRPGRPHRFPSGSDYGGAVTKAQEHIRAGDIYQVVLSQRVERPTSATAVELYRSLRRINPSPYLFLLELGELSLIGSSPETLVKVEGDRASVNPIAGTVPRESGDAERLLASEKDRAEHVMLVDLGRNDLSRVCRPGTVRVERFLQPERYSHVTHLVSEVAGEVISGISPFDVLRACFPAGTVTGAPKVRAMQLISELEDDRRGLYGGAVGYAMPGGALDTCIAIRTIVLVDGIAHLRAGAGIVADSDPEAEHRECLAKLAALEAAVGDAEALT
ncbi:MAG TPA: anthranilate synthase component I family protein [Actinomycetota bacterium]|nr:anthranilate synthase component I family protein [Actinomycetota bacterium]